VLHTAADGNGPVNALDSAMRKALGAFFPQLATMRLVDYKVRIIDGNAATAARTRVIIDSIDEDLEWSTMGSDTNIISASAIALADSFEYAIWKRQATSAAEANGEQPEPAAAGGHASMVAGPER
jgi:2-isopropylmalate synthase